MTTKALYRKHVVKCALVIELHQSLRKSQDKLFPAEIIPGTPVMAKEANVHKRVVERLLVINVCP